MTIEQSELDKAKLDEAIALAAKAKADAQKAAVDAAKAQREEQEASGALGQAQREAAANKAISDAEKSQFEAQQARVAALIPDLSKATVPELKGSGDQALFSSRVTHQALGNAAKALSTAVGPSLPAKGAGLVLVTTADDLASLDGAYVEVDQGLTILHEAADALLPPKGAGLAPALIAAAVAAVPGLISFFAPARSVSSHAVTADDSVVVAEVTGRLLGSHDVMLADFRTVPKEGVVKRDKDLMTKRAKLVGKDTEKADAEADMAAEQAKLDAVLAKYSQGTETPEATTEIATAKRARDLATARLVQKTGESEQIADVIEGIDDFRTAIHAVATGSTRSALVTAAMYEALHGGAGTADRFAAVLFVKPGGGSIDQLTESRKFRKDTFEVLGTATIAYWVVDPLDSLVRASGTAVGSARLQGTIGGSLIVTES